MCINSLKCNFVYLFLFVFRLVCLLIQYVCVFVVCVCVYVSQRFVNSCTRRGASEEQLPSAQAWGGPLATQSCSALTGSQCDISNSSPNHQTTNNEEQTAGRWTLHAPLPTHTRKKNPEMSTELFSNMGRTMVIVGLDTCCTRSLLLQ